MGAEDGWTALHELKTNPRTAIPVIIVSVLDEKQAGFALGPPNTWSAGVQRHLPAALARHVA
jgi:CheY-like chemotaxis protein